MKVRCDRNEFSERLLAIQAIVSSGPTTKPILQDVLLRAGADELIIHATDMDTSARMRVERVDVEEQGIVALNAGRLMSLVREIPSSSLSISSQDGDGSRSRAAASSGYSASGGEENAGRDVGDGSWGDGNWAVLAAEGFQFRLLTDDASEFPEVPEFSTEGAITALRDKFVEMLRRVSIAASREQGRYQLNGVYFEVDGEKLTMTATDGKRLTNDSMRVDNAAPGQVSGIVPNAAVEVLLKVLASGEEKFQFALQPTQIQVSFRHGQISAKLVEGAYPDYQSAMPSEKRTKVTVRRADLLAAVRGASLVTDRETQTVTFKFSGDTATIESHAKDVGESQIQVPITFDGEPLEIRFSPTYFLDALRVVTEEQVRLEFCGSNRPGTVRGGLHYRHLLMPLVVG